MRCWFICLTEKRQFAEIMWVECSGRESTGFDLKGFLAFGEGFALRVQGLQLVVDARRCKLFLFHAGTLYGEVVVDPGVFV